MFSSTFRYTNVDSGHPGLIVGTGAQTNLARVKRLTEKTQEFRYHEKHRKSLAHSLDTLPASEMMQKGVQDWRRSIRSHMKRGLPKGELIREVKIVELRIE